MKRAFVLAIVCMLWLGVATLCDPLAFGGPIGGEKTLFWEGEYKILPFVGAEYIGESPLGVFGDYTIAAISFDNQTMSYVVGVLDLQLTAALAGEFGAVRIGLGLGLPCGVFWGNKQVRAERLDPGLVFSLAYAFPHQAVYCRGELYWSWMEERIGFAVGAGLDLFALGDLIWKGDGE
jgi:hypothetical protein